MKSVSGRIIILSVFMALAAATVFSFSACVEGYNKDGSKEEDYAPYAGDVFFDDQSALDACAGVLFPEYKNSSKRTAHIIRSKADFDRLFTAKRKARYNAYDTPSDFDADVPYGRTDFSAKMLVVYVYQAYHGGERFEIKSMELSGKSLRINYGWIDMEQGGTCAFTTRCFVVTLDKTDINQAVFRDVEYVGEFYGLDVKDGTPYQGEAQFDGNPPQHGWVRGLLTQYRVGYPLPVEGGYFIPKNCPQTFIVQTQSEFDAFNGRVRESYEQMKSACDKVSATHGTPFEFYFEPFDTATPYGGTDFEQKTLLIYVFCSYDDPEKAYEIKSINMFGTKMLVNFGLVHPNVSESYYPCTPRCFVVALDKSDVDAVRFEYAWWV
ncbi:MAG: hypothetical protein FWD58_03380 [Firmicutes bacterium]|nr:hypothetical protein [Bacillota bacterium]